MSGYARMAGLELVTPSDDFDPLESQRGLQAIIHDRKTAEGKQVTDHSKPAETVGELLARLRFNKEAFDAEHVEALEFLPWKEWKTYDVSLDAPVDELGEALVELQFEKIDQLHFVLNDMLALGMDWAYAMRIFATKQQENRDRQARGY